MHVVWPPVSVGTVIAVVVLIFYGLGRLELAATLLICALVAWKL